MNGIGLVALILFVFASFYLYQQRQIETIIPKIEKVLNATFYDSSYLTVEKLNQLKIFKHQVTDIESIGHFKNNTRVTEYIKILFVKKDTEDNDIENILFDGKVTIENGNELILITKKPEYFEAGDSLTNPTKVDYDKKYTFTDDEKLFI